ncbi:MAG: MipA/OmpV family protein [Kangiellaceae bacterium]|jgi:outer membrane scaffolding protein for murein synthesis (MipA/OmpV family)|nr:MipA/OmpV family protein [Kangiellaceae bacterium]
MKNTLISLLACLLITQPIWLNASEDSTTFSVEYGIGLSVIDVPQYAGSNESINFALPFPYAVIESDKLKINREGVRSELFDYNNWSLNLSFAGQLPLDSDDSNARRGMPDLEWMALAGPALNYQFVETDSNNVKFSLPLHLAFEFTSESVNGMGYELAPSVRWEHTIASDDTIWRSILMATRYYSDEKLNDYYYSVAPQFANSERAAYSSESGLGGYQMMLGITRRHNDIWIGSFFRYRSVSSAVFSDSPLVKQNYNWYVGVAFAYILGETEIKI